MPQRYANDDSLDDLYYVEFDKVDELYRILEASYINPQLNVDDGARHAVSQPTDFTIRPIEELVRENDELCWGRDQLSGSKPH